MRPPRSGRETYSCVVVCSRATHRWSFACHATPPFALYARLYTRTTSKVSHTVCRHTAHACKMEAVPTEYFRVSRQPGDDGFSLPRIRLRERREAGNRQLYWVFQRHLCAFSTCMHTRLNGPRTCTHTFHAVSPCSTTDPSTAAARGQSPQFSTKVASDRPLSKSVLQRSRLAMLRRPSTRPS